MAVDLHSHSIASDGSDKPTRLVELALEKGLTALALTDHDTQEGVVDARSAAAGTELELISGTELSLNYGGGECTWWFSGWSQVWVPFRTGSNHSWAPGTNVTPGL